MQIASFLLVTSSLVAPAPSPATNAPATGVEAAVAYVPAQQRATMSPLSTSSPARRLGLGGSLSVSNRGVGGSTRYFFNKHFGAAMSAAWQRPFAGYVNYSPGVVTQINRTSTVTASPSLIFAFNETDQNREVSLRPYVGMGAGYLRASRPATQPTTAPGQLPGSQFSYSGTSEHVSFGSEIFFRDHPNFALSAEAIYYNIPSNFFNRYYVDGMNFQVAATFYLK